ncbi:uncharacterized protein V6R79_017573 [Siganus canaliculatus]
MAALGFTPASGSDVFCIDSNGTTRTPTGPGLRGEEARHFYESLIKSDVSRQRSRESSRRPRRRLQQGPAGAGPGPGSGAGAGAGSGPPSGASHRSDGHQRRDSSSSSSSVERSTELLGLRLLRCAHEGDVSGLRDLLSKGVDVNFQDTYLWTAMMCACWSGKRAAVRLLLQHGAAWVGVVDTQGRDARDLALEAAHREVLEELENYGRSRSTQPEAQRGDSASPTRWCDVCRGEFSGSLTSHRSSTLHQFSSRRPPPAPYYCLPPSSTSFQMMLRCGWRPGSGLGPEGDGRQQPVSTVLKRDHKGLGFGQRTPARVTHFRARDPDAVKPPSSREDQKEPGRGLRRKESRRKEQRDRNWERDFRSSFYL